MNDKRVVYVRGMGEEWAKDDWCTIGRALVLHWFFIGSGLVFGMEFVDTFLGGSRSFRKRKDAPGTEFVPNWERQLPLRIFVQRYYIFLNYARVWENFFEKKYEAWKASPR